MQNTLDMNPITSTLDLVADTNTIPWGTPIVLDASSGNFPVVVGWVSSRYIIQVAGTLPAPVWAVGVGDYVVRDWVNRSYIDMPDPSSPISSYTLYINVNDPEVVGKQYQSVANAQLYLASLTTPPAENTNPRAIRLAGYISEPITTMVGVSYVGDGIYTTILESVTVGTSSSDTSKIFNATIKNTYMSDEILDEKKRYLYLEHCKTETTDFAGGGICVLVCRDCLLPWDFNWLWFLESYNCDYWDNESLANTNNINWWWNLYTELNFWKSLTINNISWASINLVSWTLNSSWCSSLNVNMQWWTRTTLWISDCDNKKWNWDPTNITTPTRVLQQYLDIDTNSIYVSTGLTSANWVQMWTFTS